MADVKIPEVETLQKALAPIGDKLVRDVLSALFVHCLAQERRTADLQHRLRASEEQLKDALDELAQSQDKRRQLEQLNAELRSLRT